LYIKEEIWIEKYRPERLDDIVGQDEIVRRLKSYVKTRNLPHLLFSGPPGVGKTAASISIVKEIFGETWRNNFIELNASDERGIDIIRHKVKDFARMAPLGEADFKVIFLDEADALTNDAQSALPGLWRDTPLPPGSYSPATTPPRSSSPFSPAVRFTASSPSLLKR